MSSSSNTSSDSRVVHRENGWLDLDTLRDAFGITAVISQRRSNGTITFAIFKEFERDGRMERTSFIPEVLGDAYEAMVKLARERIVELRKGDLPFASKSRNG